jgi:tetratricopeptide (TPR) repeat protein
MTSQEAGALEAALANNPEDLQARKKLMFYYGFATTGPQVKAAERQAAVSILQKHILWFIERHPEEPVSSWGVLTGDSDLKFYADAKHLWQRVDREGAPAAAYLNGAQFLMYVDPPFAEKLLLRAQAADPSAESLGGMYGGSWSARLGSFYGQALTQSSTPDFQLKRLSATEEMASFVAQVRRRLEQSNDTTLLLFAVQSPLASFRPNEPGRDAATEIFRFAQQLVERVIQLDPKQTRAHELRNKVRDQELVSRLPKSVTAGQLESRVPAIRALPEGERFREMSILAISAWDAALRAERYRNIPGGVPLQGSFEQAGRYAQEALSLAPGAKNHPDYGASLLRANVMAGMAAQKAGDIKAAVRYLNASLDAPISEDLKYPIIDARPWPNNWRPPFVLLAALYKAGERGSLADYLERYARVSVSDHNRCLEIAADIRAGRVPNWPYSSD